MPPQAPRKMASRIIESAEDLRHQLLILTNRLGECQETTNAAKRRLDWVQRRRLIAQAHSGGASVGSVGSGASAVLYVEGTDTAWEGMLSGLLQTVFCTKDDIKWRAGQLEVLRAVWHDGYNVMVRLFPPLPRTTPYPHTSLVLSCSLFIPDA